MNEDKSYAWLRFALGRKRKRGHMKQALDCYLRRLFDYNLHRIEGEVYAYNIPSRKVLEQLGFRLEGQKRQAHMYKNTYYDVLVYGLLKEDYHGQI
jgi:ribosomal-protein-alanine N-acetyltransferase